MNVLTVKRTFWPWVWKHNRWMPGWLARKAWKVERARLVAKANRILRDQQ